MQSFSRIFQGFCQVFVLKFHHTTPPDLIVLHNTHTVVALIIFTLHSLMDQVLKIYPTLRTIAKQYTLITPKG